MFDKSSREKTETLLVVGLGNPGTRYEHTRHNVGFRLIDALGETLGIAPTRARFQALVGEGQAAGRKVVLLKPTTFMNLSGRAVAQAAAWYHLPPEAVFVISDDVALPLGRLRLRRQGSAGGHNGLKDIIAALGSDAFPRLKIGVGGKPHPDYDMADWVLGRFSPQDEKLLAPCLEDGRDAVLCFLSQGMDAAMSRYNRERKPAD